MPAMNTDEYRLNIALEIANANVNMLVTELAKVKEELDTLKKTEK
jgi:hypothetical protein